MHSHIFADEFPVYVNVCLNCYELLSELHVLKELTQHIIHDGTLCYFGEEKKHIQTFYMFQWFCVKMYNAINCL